jgi:hypothetical protein
MPDQSTTIDLSSGLVPNQPAQDSGIDLSAGLTPKITPQANPGDESQMFSATTGAPTADGQQIQPTHIYNPATKAIQPVTSPSSVGADAWDEAKSVGKAAVQPIINDAQALTPMNAREHAIISIGGPGALYGYKTAARLIDAAEGVFKARGKDWENAKQDFNRAVTEFKQKDYRNAVPTVGDLVSDIGGRNADLVRGREISEGLRPGGDAATPITKDAIDALAALIADKAPVPEAMGKAGEAVESVNDVATKAADKINTMEVRPEALTKRPETPAPQHGTPVKVESPLDGPTVGKQLGGKDLSQEALDALNKHAGDKIPVGGTAKGQLMKAVEPVQRTINETASKMNGIVQNAKPFTTSVMQDSVFGEGKLQADIDAVKENIPPSVREALSKDIDGVMKDADKALNSNDPAEVLEYRRQLGNKIDWDSIEKNPSTPAEVQNAARVKVYRAIGEKIHSEIPDTVELDKTLSPNLELRSHMVRKLGERVVEDPHAATVEAQSELKKGQQTVDNAAHNEMVAKNWGRIKAALITAGVGTGVLEGIKHAIDLF